MHPPRIFVADARPNWKEQAEQPALTVGRKAEFADRRGWNAMLEKRCPGQSGVAALVILQKSDRNPRATFALTDRGRAVLPAMLQD